MPLDPVAAATLRVAVETLWATVLLGIPSLLIAVVALFIARSALANADRNASASLVVTLQEGFSSGWRRFLTTEDAARKDYEFAELMNVFETAASVHQEGVLQGNAKKMVESHLCNSLELISQNADAQSRIPQLRESPDTFKHLIHFISQVRRRGRVSDFVALVDMLPKGYV